MKLHELRHTARRSARKIENNCRLFFAHDFASSLEKWNSNVWIYDFVVEHRASLTGNCIAKLCKWEALRECINELKIKRFRWARDEVCIKHDDKWSAYECKWNDELNWMQNLMPQEDAPTTSSTMNNNKLIELVDDCLRQPWRHKVLDRTTEWVPFEELSVRCEMSFMNHLSF